MPRTRQIISKGSTVKEFFSLLRNATDEDPDGEDAIFGQIITACADFDIFMQMMREAKETEDREKKESRK